MTRSGLGTWSVVGKRLVQCLIVACLLMSIGALAAAAPDIEAKAVDDLLRASKTPSREDLTRLLGTPKADPWLLAEHLVARDRGDVAMALATLTKPDEVGPLRAYVEGASTGDRATRLAALDAGRDAALQGSLDEALGHLRTARTAGSRPSTTGVRVLQLRGHIQKAQEHETEAIQTWLRAGEEALRLGWWRGAQLAFDTAIENAFAARSFDLLAQAMEGLRAVRELRGQALELASTEYDLGSISHWRGDLPGAVRHYTEAARIYEALGKSDDVAGAKSLRSLVLAELGDVRAAMQDQSELAPYLSLIHISEPTRLESK